MDGITKGLNKNRHLGRTAPRGFNFRSHIPSPVTSRGHKGGRLTPWWTGSPAVSEYSSIRVSRRTQRPRYGTSLASREGEGERVEHEVRDVRAWERNRSFGTRLAFGRAGSP